MSSQPNPPHPINLDALRDQLAGKRGPAFWRSLEEAAGDPRFQAYLDDEFTPGNSEWTDPPTRRRLLELLGATLGLAGLTSCTRQPPEKIVPYVSQPEDIIPGKPLYFASAIPLSGIAAPVLVESHMGRPTKIEGNPEHPACLGASDVFAQAAALGLWDPERAQAVFYEGRNSTWLRFQEAARMLREQLLANRGAGFRLLTETVTSPTLAAYIRDVLAAFPEARWHQFEPVSRDSVRAGARIAFGEPVNSVYQLDRADVIVALDSDFLTSGPGAVRYAQNFARRRGGDGMCRLYALEPTPSLTGAMADHRLAVSSADVENFARALAAELGTGIGAAASKVPPAWLKAIAQDLRSHQGASLVVPGEFAPAAVHAITHAINVALGNVGKTVIYTDAVEANPVDQHASLRDLVADMQAGRVETLLIAGGNPVYTAPVDLNFSAALKRTKTRIRLGEYFDETSAECTWQIPMAHALECWGDQRTFDGVVTLQQPLIAPLYEGRQLIDILLLLLDKGGREVRDLVKEHWTARLPKQESFDAFWQKSIHDGFIAGSAPAPKQVTLRKELPSELGAARPASGTELLFRPCPSVYDGRFANNAWLQELPRSLTKLTWDNAVLVSPALATARGLSNGDVVNVRVAGHTVAGPVWILPGQAEGAVTLHLGYGRTRVGKVGNGVGFNANLIRTSAAPWNVSGGELTKTGASHEFAVTQEHSSMEGRNFIRMASLEEFKKHPDFAREEEKNKHLFSLYPEVKYEGYSWGMTIDLNACTGCNACTIACQAENNIAVVGKDQVSRGREMHWIRIDRYFEGNLDDPAIHHQPVTCMHCDNAPCEPVCPVAATTHSTEGLNQMTYNRCVGTRYCSNNCPYKVRRFNFYLYNDWDTQSLHGLRNPNVTVRSRGVMEKCTYCVQRINAARIEAEKEDRRLKDGEVITACQQVCPAQAIYFGDMNDPNSKVAKIKKDQRDYALLVDLNTLPRTSYLAKVRNPNPELART